MVGVLGVDEQLVADLSFGHELEAAGGVGDAAQASAPGGVGGDLEVVVGDLGAGHRFPPGAATGRAAGRPGGPGGPGGLSGGPAAGPVGGVADPGHVLRPEAEAHRARQGTGLDQDRHGLAGVVGHLQRLARGGSRHVQDGQVGAVPGLGVEHDRGLPVIVGRGAAGSRGGYGGDQVSGGASRHPRRQLVGLPPPAQQVEVDLVGLRTGDAVVVGIEHQLAPGLVELALRHRRAQGGGQGGQQLGVGQLGLGLALRLLGVDERDVLARIDRAHVTGLGRRLPPLAGELGAHGVEEVAGDGHFEAGPGVAPCPFPRHVGDPAAGRGVVGAHRQEGDPGGCHLGQVFEQLVGPPHGPLQRGGPFELPARGVVGGHVAGEQAPAVGGDPFELGGELHPRRAPGGSLGAPLVERAPGPGRGGEPGFGHDPGELGVVGEHVQLPGALGIGTHDVALETEAVHGGTDPGLGAGQVGVGLVVGAADYLHPPGRDQVPQLLATVGVEVPEGLEVVDFGEDDLVGRVDARPFQMGLDQGQAAVLKGLPPVLGPDQLVPAGGVGGLGVPPHRVVVKMGDHQHAPARLADHHLALGLGLGAGLARSCHRPQRHRGAGGQLGVENDGDLHHDPVGQARRGGETGRSGQPGVAAGCPGRAVRAAGPLRRQGPPPGLGPGQAVAGQRHLGLGGRSGVSYHDAYDLSQLVAPGDEAVRTANGADAHERPLSCSVRRQPGHGPGQSPSRARARKIS